MMIRRIFIGIFIVGVIGSTFAVPKSVGAETDVITDAQIEKIRSQCTELQATIAQLHASDRVLRIDRGRLYDTVANKLMVPFNQRVASNQLDGSSLVSITAKFNRADKAFYDTYRTYDDSLTELSSIDCSAKPSQFYSALKTARTNRQALAKSAAKLNGLAKEYRSHVDDFRDKIGDKSATE